jgi:uncharacterized damage-inducible protein DinB
VESRGAQDLVDLSDHAWERLQARLAGLGDDEYLWTPADGVMTIAWRVAHIASGLTEERIALWLGVDLTPPAAGDQTTAAGAMGWLEDAYAHWRLVLTSMSDDDLRAPIGAAAGPYADASRNSFVLHMLDELIHHGAEVALLRDLYPR